MQLADRFRRSFWVDSPLGPHPAVALDGELKPVAVLTSNIGHLLGTGICNPSEAAAIAKLLRDPQLNSGAGLRTLPASVAGYNPIGYHTGAVWSHDTMIAARGLAADEFRAEATALAHNVLDAAAHFGGRLPELYGGYPAKPGRRPTAYAAACRPQAWSAASSIEALRLLLGYTPDFPRRRVQLAATADERLPGLQLSGFRLGNAQVALSVDLLRCIELRTDAPLTVVRH